MKRKEKEDSDNIKICSYIAHAVYDYARVKFERLRRSSESTDDAGVSPTEINNSFRELVANDLSLSAKEVNPFNIKQAFPIKNKHVSTDINNVPYKSIIILAQWSGLIEEKTNNPFVDVKNISDSLLEKKKIKDDTLREQYLFLNINIVEWKYFFVGFYSRGNEITSLLFKATATWDKYQILFRPDNVHPEGSLQEGSNPVEMGNNLFLVLKHKEPAPYTGLVSFLSLLRKPLQPDYRLDNIFDGFYCSAITTGTSKINAPVAGRIILVKNNSETLAKEIMDKNIVPNNIYYSLLGAQLVYSDSSEARDLINNLVKKSLVGSYEGYWFYSENNKSYLRKLILRISSNGLVEYSDEETGTVKGFIVKLDVKHNYLKLHMGQDIDGSYRLQIIINIEPTSDVFLTGTYSGLRFNYSKIMAGRIKFYPITDDISLYKPEIVEINLEDDLLRLSKRMNELLLFFKGSSNDNYIPVLNDKIQQHINLFDSYWSGTYKLLKLYSRRKENKKINSKINQYLLDVKVDGRLTGKLYISGNNTIKNEYTGKVISFEEFLIIDIYSMNKRDWHCKYIFWVGKSNKNTISNCFGVYASIGVDGNPICGRAVLKPEDFDYESAIDEQIEIGSINYHNLDGDLASVLTGFENNLIKSKRSVNSFEREIDYAGMFFSHACYLAQEGADSSKIIENIIFSLEHGYSNVNQLKREIEPNGSLASIKNNIVFYEIDGSVEISVHSNDTSITWNIGDHSNS